MESSGREGYHNIKIVFLFFFYIYICVFVYVDMTPLPDNLTNWNY